MAAARTARAVAGLSEALAVFTAERCSDPRRWGNGPGETYGRHAHGYHKVLFCLSGSIAFHTADGEVELQPGDRLDLEPETQHAATVGPRGVECVEAAR